MKLMVNRRDLFESQREIISQNFKVNEGDIIEVFERLMQSSLTTTITREYGLTAIAKLATRFEQNAERIHALIRNYMAHMNLELQQRSVEYSNVLLKNGLK